MVARPFFSGNPGCVRSSAYLALLVAPKHQPMLGRRHVKTRDIFELLNELRVAQNLEAADEVRFETVRAPMPWSTPPDVPVRP
jgi:hypothetical protein